MWTRAEVKERGKIAFRAPGRYWSCVAVSVIAAILGGGGASGFGGASGNLSDKVNNHSYTNDYHMYSQGGASFAEKAAILAIVAAVVIIIALIGFAFQAFVGNAIEVGSCRYYIENRAGFGGVGRVFYGFSCGNYLHMVFIQFLRRLFTALWTLLFIVPGIVKGLEYSMIPYIVAENPNIDRKRAFELSRQMMDGEKWNVFVLRLSFIGWEILSAMTCGILGVFYVNPYVDATMADLYTTFRWDALQTGIASAADFPGVVEWEQQ